MEDQIPAITGQTISKRTSALCSSLLEARGNVNSHLTGQLDKFCRELDYITVAFEKLEKFEADIIELLETLKSNVNDLLKDIQTYGTSSLPKQVLHNADVLRSNLTKMKIQIPLQHHSLNPNSEASRYFKKTITGRAAQGSPSLLQTQEMVEQSDYFQAIRVKFESFDSKSQLCLLSFLIFPEDAEVKKTLLMYWWIGENLVPHGKAAEDFLDEILKDFADKDLIETVGENRIFGAKRYRVKPTARPALKILAKKCKAFVFDSEGNPTMDTETCGRACLVQIRDETGSSTTKEFLNIRPEELKTLFNVSKQLLHFKEGWFSKMKEIRVLYLGKWESVPKGDIGVESGEFLKDLKNSKKLTLLSLQGIFGIRKLPNCICELSKLKIMDLRACHDLEQLPEDIGLLKNLIHLDISECYLLKKMPKKLSSLEKLQVLKGFVIWNDRKSCRLRDLAKLGELRKLSIYISSDNFDVEECGVVLSSFRKLQKLQLEWGGGSRQTQRAKKKGKPVAVDPNKLTSLGMLEKLELRCFHGRELPSWLVPGKLTNLKKLYIRGGNIAYLNKVEGQQNWEVEILRLKFLTALKLEFLHELFPKLRYLERFKCPGAILGPGDDGKDGLFGF